MSDIISKKDESNQIRTTVNKASHLIVIRTQLLITNL